MATTIYEASTSAGSNTSIGGVDQSEGCAPSTVNNATRAIVAMTKGALVAVSASGTDTYTATLAPAPVAYVTGATYAVTFASANLTATPTLNLNSLGAKTIVKEGNAALVAGDIPGSHEAILRYNGTNMVLMNPKAVTGVTSLADATNGGLQFSAATGAVTANLKPGDLSTKATPVAADSFLLMDSAASSAAKTALLSAMAASSATTFTGSDTTQWLTAGGFAGNLSNASPGYLKLPGGVIIQWGTVASVGINTTKTQALAVAFPTACYMIVASYNSTAPASNAAGATCSTSTVTVFNASSTNAFDICWIAIGH